MAIHVAGMSAGVIGGVRLALGECHVVRLIDKLAERIIGDEVAIHPKAAHRDAVSRRFLRIVMIGAHQEGPAGNPDHTVSRLAARRRMGNVMRPRVEMKVLARHFASEALTHDASGRTFVPPLATQGRTPGSALGPVACTEGYACPREAECERGTDCKKLDEGPRRDARAVSPI
jgi:hypothetical protein